MKTNAFSIFNVKKVVGLYVSHETVDLVMLQGGIGGPKLVKFGQTYIYPKEKGAGEIIPESGKDVVAAERKTRDDYIVEAVKRVFKENNVKPGNVVTAIPSEEVMVRYFQMPKMPKQEWHSAINFEAKRYIPFRMEDVIFDFQVMQSKANTNVMDVVFVAVKRNVVEDLVKLLAKAGVRPILMEPAPFSLIRALNAAGQISNKINTAIVDIDIFSVNINILRNGVPYIIRDVAISSAPGASEEKILEPIFEKLLGEIKLSFDFYEKQFPNEVIDKIIVYSRIPLGNWHELAGKELQIPIDIGDPLRSIKVKKGMVPARAAICFGLALRGLSDPFVEVNLCKENMLVYKKKELFLKAIFLEASAALFLLILFKVFTVKAIAPLANELTRTLSERPKIEVVIKNDDIRELEKIKNEMEARRSILERNMSSRTYVTSRLADLARLTPKNIWLVEVNFEEKVDKKNVTKISRFFDIKGYCLMDGKVSETDIVNNFLADLKEEKSIYNGMSRADIVSVKKTELKDKKVASFEILLIGP